MDLLPVTRVEAKLRPFESNACAVRGEVQLVAAPLSRLQHAYSASSGLLSPRRRLAWALFSHTVEQSDVLVIGLALRNYRQRGRQHQNERLITLAKADGLNVRSHAAGALDACGDIDIIGER